MTKGDAEREIGQILKRLEIDTGALVERVVLIDIDVTNLGSTRREMQARVEIEMRHVPGRRW